jgi:hypothetical protein
MCDFTHLLTYGIQLLTAVRVSAAPPQREILSLQWNYQEVGIIYTILESIHHISQIHNIHNT